jgi:ArsR family transcriptional regulator, arsenate/arsenite/antimonite-responsive transcriptional repressor / arsenate reductase (thioredoxin)
MTLLHSLEVFRLAGRPAGQTSLFYQPHHFIPPLRVLFLCTQNNARSQMAEALLRHLSHGTIEVYSAGSSPTARIHPLVLRTMEAVGIEMYEQYPKHLDRYRGQHFDTVVTVCDWGHETCPAFPNDPEQIQWTFPDPTKATGSDEERYAVFEKIGLQLTTRLRLLMTLLSRKHQ